MQEAGKYDLYQHVNDDHFYLGHPLPPQAPPVRPGVAAELRTVCQVEGSVPDPDQGLREEPQDIFC